jgi:hypothetical protein
MNGLGTAATDILDQIHSTSEIWTLNMMPFAPVPRSPRCHVPQAILPWIVCEIRIHEPGAASLNASKWPRPRAGLGKHAITVGSER